MAISNDTKHLIIVNGIPEYIHFYSGHGFQEGASRQIKYYLFAGQLGNSSQPRYIFAYPVLFNPADSNEFLVLYNNQMSLFKIETEYEMVN